MTPKSLLDFNIKTNHQKVFVFPYLAHFWTVGLWLCRSFSDLCLHLLCVRSPPAFQGCTAADDKTAAVEDFLRYLYGAMASDAIWQYASEEQLQDAQMAIERSVMNRIFKLAFYPNQDGDILRDQWVSSVVSAHIHSSNLGTKGFLIVYGAVWSKSNLSWTATQTQKWHD